MQAAQYHETLLSVLYPGSQHSSPTYIPLLRTLASWLALTPLQRSKTVLRTDAGFGGDVNVDFALDEGWQVLTKGSGGRRPGAWAKQISESAWHTLTPRRWIAPSPTPTPYVRPVQQWLLRWVTETGQVRHSTLLCSLPDCDAHTAATLYDARGACETEIRTDKQGLALAHHRKHRLAAQEALILLTDIAHNTLAWLAPILFPEGPLAAFGPQRLIRDVFTLPGRLRFDQHRLVEVQLCQTHPYARQVADALLRLLAHFGWP